MFDRTLLSFGISLLCSLPAHAFDFDFNKALDIAKKIQQSNKTLDEPAEIQIGHGIASNLLGASSLLPDNQVQQYVNQVGRWLSLQTERPDLPWQFGVLASSDINAFATPGGTIFITNGLLQKLNNESELAGVLAHEMVHVLRKHHLAALQKAARMDLASSSRAMRSRTRPIPPSWTKPSRRERKSMRAAWTRMTNLKRTAWASW
jgi:predicted Zn-dependent protease